jgi:hypothetical protein
VETEADEIRAFDAAAEEVQGSLGFKIFIRDQI